MTRALILSVKPVFAMGILDGTKSTELRARGVAVPEGTSVIVYATAPMKAIVGTGRLRKTMLCAPEAAWEVAGNSLGLDRSEFDRYTVGRKTVSLLFLEAVIALEQPITLADLRNGHPFHPPQAYRYVSPSDPQAVHVLIEHLESPEIVSEPPASTRELRLSRMATSVRRAASAAVGSRPSRPSVLEYRR